MRNVSFRRLGLAALPLSLLAGCGTLGGLAGRERPDEFAVTRNAPLVIPPDYSIVPPRPGDPRATAADAQAQALAALFGGPAPRSAAETTVLDQAGADRAASGVRSTVGDPETEVVNKGALTRDILVAPEGDGRDARVAAPTGTPETQPQQPQTPQQ